MHVEQLLDLYCSINIIRVVKLRWAGHVARMGEMKNTYTFWLRKSEGEEQFEDLGVDGMVILKTSF